MSRPRFATASALFDAYPELRQKMNTDPADQPPTEFLKALTAAKNYSDALTFCAYLLPRREAVWWACRCVRILVGEISPEQSAALKAAEAWVYDPGDARRQAALDVGTKGDGGNPRNWLALAAGWSGGFLASTSKKQVPVPLHMTPRAARIAVLTSVQKASPNLRAARLQECVLEGIKLAETGL